MENLYESIRENFTYDYDFVCLTDILQTDSDIPQMLLHKGLQGAWSKLEVFRLKGEVIYFDLDTIILDNIDSLLEGMRSIKHSYHNRGNQVFFMLEAFSSARQWASGIMAWEGDYEFILDRLLLPKHLEFYKKWDQDYIVDTLVGDGRWEIHSINHCLGIGTILSYKHHCLNKKIPKDTSIICFHGKPRPHEINLSELKLKSVGGLK